MIKIQTSLITSTYGLRPAAVYVTVILKLASMQLWSGKQICLDPNTESKYHNLFLEQAQIVIYFLNTITKYQ